MSFGQKIKKLRIEANLTQKDLADKLNVTFQTVSKWESDTNEPDISSIKELAKIFNCSIEYLFKDDEPETKEEVKEEKVQVIEKVIIQEAKPMLAVCEKCNKPLYESSEINRVTFTTHHRTGRTHHTEHHEKVLCNACNAIRLEQEKQERERAKRAREAEFAKRRIHSFIWPTLVAVIFIIVGIVNLVNKSEGGVACLVMSVFAFAFVAVMILDNTFIPEMWGEIASWGFVKLPGIIFEFSIDGFVFLIAMKILFFILGMFLAILAAAFATGLAMALSIFVYPFALVKNIRCEE